MTIRCKALRHDWDGHVYEEIHRQTSYLVWVARLECKDCGSQRVDFMTPHSCELISRRYFHSEEYNTTMDHYEAKRQLFSSMLIKGG